MEFRKTDPRAPINLVFLGCGFATRIHSKTLSGFRPGVQCFYASRKESKALEYNERFRGQGSFSSYREAIASPHTDVVFIATPPDSHLELTLQAMEAGKHVIVEKPPFFKSTDFDLILKKQKETKTQVMVAENYYYKPLLNCLRELLQTEVIGRPLFININATKTQKTENWRDNPNLSGGGALFEGGIHWVSFMNNMGFSLSKAHGFIPGARKEMEKSVLAVMEYKEGPLGNLLYSWEVNTLFKGLRLSKVFGTKGSITFETNGVFLFVRGKKWRFLFPGFKDIAGYRGMFKDFFLALQSGKEPAYHLRLAKRDLEVIEMIYSSSKQSII